MAENYDESPVTVNVDLYTNSLENEAGRERSDAYYQKLQDEMDRDWIKKESIHVLRALVANPNVTDNLDNDTIAKKAVDLAKELRKLHETL